MSPVGVKIFLMAKDEVYETPFYEICPELKTVVTSLCGSFDVNGMLCALAINVDGISDDRR